MSTPSPCFMSSQNVAFLGLCFGSSSRSGTTRGSDLPEARRNDRGSRGRVRRLATGGRLADLPAERGFVVMDGLLVAAWRVTVGDTRLFLDAVTGEPVGRQSLTSHADSREIYYADPGDPPLGNCNAGCTWPEWTRVWDNDPAFSAATPWPGTSAMLHMHVEQMRSFMWTRWGRDGWDDNPSSIFHRMRAASDVTSSPLYVVIPFGAGWVPSAFAPRQAQWTHDAMLGATPLRASAIFGPEANCLDTVSHEFFHGVQGDELGVRAGGSEASALDEGLSDAAGRVVEAAFSSTPDWVTGTGGTCSGYRSLSDPEAPASAGGGSCSTCAYGASHYSNFQRWDTSGGSSNSNPDAWVYANATIVNKAFYLVAREPSAGAVSFAGRSVTGVGSVEASHLLYGIVRDELSVSDGFFGFSSAWQDAAYARWGLGTNFYRATAAIHAVGTWTGSFSENAIQTDRRAAFAPFTVGSDARTYVAYRQRGTASQLQVRYRSGTVWNSSAWSTASTLSFTAAGPALVSYSGQLWLFNRYDLNTNLLARTMSSAGTWTTAPLPGPPQTDSDVAAVEFGGSLLVFYRGVGSGPQPIYYLIRSGGVWSGPVTAGFGVSSDSGPAVAVVGSRLYLVYRRGTAISNLFYRSLDSPVSGVFSSEVAVGRQSTLHVSPSAATGSPTALAYRGRLHVASQSVDGNTRYPSYCYCAGSPCGCEYRPNEWTQTVRLPQQTAAASPTLYTDGGNPSFGAPLYLFYPTTSSYWWDYKISE